MKKHLSSNRFLIIMLFVLLLPILTSCQEGAEDFQITIFTDLPDLSIKEMKGLAVEEIGLEKEPKIALYPPNVERLIVEVVGHKGDIIIVDRDLLPAIYDSEGLYQLEKLRNEDNTIWLNDFELEALLADDALTEETDIYFNALRVINLYPFLEESDYTTTSPELVAIIPKYTEYKEVSFSILEKLVKKEVN